VRPAAHYMMGGLRTDLNGACTLKNLFAAGEAACTGVHGANRLASNSLLEGLVFGARAAGAMVQGQVFTGPAAVEENQLHFQPSQVPNRDDIRDMMTAKVGIVRNASDLQFAVSRLAICFNAADRVTAETDNMSTLAYLIAQAAWARRESRGAHFRSDFPARDDVRWRKRIIWKLKKCNHIGLAAVPIKERL